MKNDKKIIKQCLIWADPLFYSGLLLSASFVMQDVSYALRDGFQLEDISFIGRAIAVQSITTLALLSERRLIISRNVGEHGLDPEVEQELIELYRRYYNNPK